MLEDHLVKNLKQGILWIVPYQLGLNFLDVLSNVNFGIELLKNI